MGVATLSTMILIQALVLTLTTLQPTLAWEKKDIKLGVPCDDICEKPSKPDNEGGNVKIAKEVLKKTTFESLFPNSTINKKYTYKGLIDAISWFPGFCKTNETCKTHITFLLTHMQQEVAGLSVITENPKNFEISCVGDSCYKGDNGTSKETYYFGRGAFQLSNNDNYKTFSKFAYKKECCLEKHPGKLISDDLEFVSAIWFFSSKEAGNMLEDDEFGATIVAMNGDQECDEECREEKKVRKEKKILTNNFGANCRLEYLRRFEQKILGKAKTTHIKYCLCGNDDSISCEERRKLDEKEEEEKSG